MVKKEEFTFDSRDGQSKIHGVRWIPEGKVTCILQIVHGMAEYIERYEETAQYFAGRGILVTGEDHLGHGKSVDKEGTYGYFCDRDPATVVVRDVHRLKKMTQELYPGVPYIILGHSMGSFITRNYLLRYGTGVQGAVICGTGSQPKALIKVSKALASFQCLVLGQKHEAKMIDRLAFGNYNQKIEDSKTDFDWLSRNEKAVDAYLEDPLCGFTFTTNGFKTLFTLIDRLGREDELRNMPGELPVFFISGDKDPVGDYGRGVKRAYESFKKAGMERLEMKLYPEDRHELFNELDREQVWEDLSIWIEERIREYKI